LPLSHTIIITDGEQRAALALVRAYGRARHRVVVCAHRGRSLAGASRFCSREELVPDALAAPGEFVAAIQQVARDTGADTLIPVTEAALLALLPERERLAGLVLPFASFEQFTRISDKALLLDAAPGVGIAVPAQLLLRAPAEELDSPSIRFPLVLKPARSVARGVAGSTKVGVSHARHATELAIRLAEYPRGAYPILLQQRVVGPGVGIFLLIWDGRPYAVFAHRRLREKPPSGGVSVYRESIAAPPDLVEKSLALLARFDWRGVAMVEYKVDESPGIPYLMQINGRFWGSLQLALDAGVDFPNLLLALAHGERPAPVTKYRLGARSRWWWGDVDHLLARLTKSDAAVALPPGEPSKLRALGNFLCLWRPGDRNEILRWDDPMPFARETLDWMQGR
jgi:predicted ATP-grasp superfamily ATP-dependent carboligase